MSEDEKKEMTKEGGAEVQKESHDTEELNKKATQTKTKVLIVDDDETNLRLLRGILQSKFSFEIIEAKNGKAALEMIKAQKPFMVILDIMMPEMDGIQALEEIRKNEETKDLPVIICSAVSEKTKIITLFNQGIVDYILKPIKPIVLVNKIKDYLRAYLAKVIAVVPTGESSEIHK
jgi:two-component system, OmpR family, alkaline phosphatase synthesis response regulator PhoP